MARAFALCDKSAFDYYKDLAEKGYFNSAISGNVNQRVEIDSIQCDFKVYPYAVTTYARVFIVRPSNVTERSLITTCTLQNAVRSDNNPQGFLMEHFVVRENQDLKLTNDDTNVFSPTNAPQVDHSRKGVAKTTMRTTKYEAEKNTGLWH